MKLKVIVIRGINSGARLPLVDILFSSQVSHDECSLKIISGESRKMAEKFLACMLCYCSTRSVPWGWKFTEFIAGWGLTLCPT